MFDIRKNMRSFLRKNDGVVAIEAAFLIPIMTVLTFSAFEVGNFFFNTAIINTVASEESRPIKTGNAWRADFVPANPGPGDCKTGKECFFEDVCDKLESLGDCNTNLAVEVRRFDTFAEAAEPEAVTCPNNPGYEAGGVPYQPGLPNDIIRVRICFTVNPLTPGIGIDLPTGEDGKTQIVSVRIFRNERFEEEDEDETETEAANG